MTAPPPPRALAVHKFGGAALATGDAVRHAAALVARRAPAPTLVVASALAGVTDRLLDLARTAPTASDAAQRDAVAALRDRHLHALDEAAGAPLADAARDELVAAFGALEALLASVRASGRTDAAALDAAAAHGERAAARILAAALAHAGLPVAVVDAALVVHTDGRHGGATPDLPATAAAARAHLRPLLTRTVVVVPGFLGRGAARDVVTLGRGGSDLTATLLGRALGARDVVLWKDVPGILAADPRVVTAPRVVPRLDVREAAALAHHGARVLHPGALVPLAACTRAGGASERRPRLHVRPFADPSAAGTVVTVRPVAARPTVHPTVRAVTATADQAVVTVAWRGFLRTSEASARVHAALARTDAAAAVGAPAWSERAVSVTVPARDAAAAAAALGAEFAREIAGGDVEPVAVRDAVVTVTLVGAGAAGDARIVGRAFGALADAGIGIVASGHAPAAAGLSVTVAADRAADAQRALHDAFLRGRPAVRVPATLPLEISA